MLFHFMLPYSRWETASIAFTESFESLTEGYAAAVKEQQKAARQLARDTAKVFSAPSLLADSVY